MGAVVMHDIAIQLRALNLAAHGGHLLVIGLSSYSDHKLLGKFYEQLFTEFDTCMELIIQHEGWISPREINARALEHLGSEREPSKGNEIFEALHKGEAQLRDLIDKELNEEKPNHGVANFLQGLYQSSLQRCYLIQQRID